MSNDMYTTGFFYQTYEKINFTLVYKIYRNLKTFSNIEYYAYIDVDYRLSFLLHLKLETEKEDI